VRGGGGASVHPPETHWFDILRSCPDGLILSRLPVPLSAPCRHTMGSKWNLNQNRLFPPISDGSLRRCGVGGVGGRRWSKRRVPQVGVQREGAYGSEEQLVRKVNDYKGRFLMRGN
jgi:hypothetical protein